ncbi:alpha/beta family hydrolase [Marinobacter sp. DUT-1]|uniref:alpha/beta family hydrolase n=1 Tax=Marinobacter sp. DUT-1 TaxID=3412037 RepID=UPI003D164054
MELIKSNYYQNQPKVVLILAHGAGAPADSPFMEELAGALDAEGIAAVRFEFPYMQKRREDGKKRPPDRQPRLLESFRSVVEQVRSEVGDACPVLIGGKSMGGRMASLLAAGKGGIDGVVCFGYPFHPPGRPDNWRIDHFPRIECPMLVVQGTRDPFGKPGEVNERQSELGSCQVVWLEGGNHDFQPLARQAETGQDLINEAARHVRQFIESLVRPDQ